MTGKQTRGVARTLFAIVLIAIFGAGWASETLASSARILSFQGRLTDSSGNLLGGTGTDYFFRFRIYDTGPGTGGTLLWESSAGSGTTAKVTQGVFNVLLGDTSLGNMAALAISFTGPRWLEVDVCTTIGCGSAETMAPRQRIGDVTRAESVEGSYASVSQYFGGGLADCDAANQVLQWDIATGRFSCGTDDTGSGGALIEVTEFPGGFNALVSSISYDAGKFALTASGATGVGINLDWGAGGPASLSQNETVTGNWSFTGPLSLTSASVSGTFEAALVKATHIDSDSNLVQITANTSVSGNFEVFGAASASSTFGSGLTSCSGATSKLLWNSATGLFSCGVDQTGGASLGIEITEGGVFATHYGSISFNAAHYALSFTGSASFVNLDWGAGGPASRSQANIWTALNVFSGGASVSGGTFEVSVPASFSALTISGPTTLSSLTVTGQTSLNTASANIFEVALLKATTIDSDSNLVQITANTSVSGNFEVFGAASASSTFGSGLTDCDGGTQKLLWNVTTGLFSCGTDLQGSGGASVGFREGFIGGFTNKSSISFNAPHFVLDLSNADARLSLDWGAGGPASLSQNEIVTGNWTFSGLTNFTGGASFSAPAEFSAGASFSSITISGTSTFNHLVFTTASGSNLELTGFSSSSALFGAGLSVCTASQKLQYNANGTFTCVTDLTGSGGANLGLREGFTGLFSNVSSVSFAAGSFNLNFSGNNASISLDWINGPASKALTNTWTAPNVFSSGASVSGAFEVSGVASVSQLLVWGTQGADIARLASATGNTLWRFTSLGDVDLKRDTTFYIPASGSLTIQSSGSAQGPFSIEYQRSKIGAQVFAGSFFGYNTQFREDFTTGRANITVDTTGAAGGGTGDSGAWGLYESTAGGCIFRTLPDAANGVLQLDGNATTVGCLAMLDDSASNARLIASASLLPTLLMKVRPSVADTAHATYVGFSTTTDGTTARPTTFMGFTNDGSAASTSWVGMLHNGAGNISRTAACGTIDTNHTAMLKMEVVSTTDVRFSVDTNTSDGISFTSCGTLTANTPTGNLAPQLLFQSRSATAGLLEVDSYEFWQDDGANPSNDFEVASSVSATGNIYDTDTPAMDTGTLVSVDTSAATFKVKAADIAYDTRMIGVVASESQNFRIINRSNDGVRVATQGRVFVKVTASNGAITVGDYLTSSTIPGVAMKATRTPVIGRSLNNWSSGGTGYVLMDILATVGADVPTSAFNSASVSGNFEVAGVASLSQLFINGALFTGRGVTSNSLDFDEFANAMTVDVATTVNALAGLTFTNASTSGTFEAALLKAAAITSDTGLVQITGRASVSQNLEIGGFASASRFFGSGQQLTLAATTGTASRSIQNAYNVLSSTGIITGATVSNNGDGTVAVSAGTGTIRATDSSIAQILFTSWSAASSLALTDLALNYIYVEYNGGSPEVIATTTERTDYETNLLVASIYRSGTTLFMNTVTRVTINEAAALANLRDTATSPFANESGGVVSATGTRNIAITAGTWWEGLTRFTTPAIDTSGAGTFTYHYDDGGSGFTFVGSQTQIDNLQYDDGDGTLATLGNGKYGVHWVYINTDGFLHLLYGQGNYSEQQALDALPPASIPIEISHNSRLVAKIIIKKSASSFYSLENTTQTAFSTSQATEHNSLTGIQGGTTDEYYHLTALQFAGISSFSFGAGVSLSDNFEVTGYASASSIFGSGLTDCDGAGQKLLWDAATGRFSCGLDLQGSGGSSVGFREGFTGGFTNKSSISFNATHFALDLSNVDARLSLDWGAGGPASLSQNEIVTGNWTFSGLTNFTGGASFSSHVEFSGGASFSALNVTNPSTFNTLTVNNLSFTTASGSNLELSGFASASQFFGGGLTTCTSAQKLQWTAGVFTCVTDLNSIFAGLQVREGATLLSGISSLSFDPGKFSITASGSQDVGINLDWGAGGPASLSQNEIVTGNWTFSGLTNFTASAQFTTLEVATASVSSLTINGLAFNPNAYLPLTGGTLTGQLIGFTASFSGSFGVSGNMYASGSFFGAGLTSCSSSGVKLTWENGLFGCGTDLTGIGGGVGILQIREFPGAFDSYPASISFAGGQFNLTSSGSSDVAVTLDWGPGGPASLSQNETVTGYREFQNGASFSGLTLFNGPASFSYPVEFSGGASFSNIAVPLSSLTAAIAENTISNGDNAQAWNWALTTASKSALTIGETSAATAVGNRLLRINALAGSTATGVFINNLGNGNSLRIDDAASDSSPFIVSADGHLGIGAAPNFNQPLLINKTFASASAGFTQTNLVINSDVTVSAGVGQTRGILAIVKNSATTAGTGVLSGALFVLQANGSQNYTAGNFTGLSLSNQTLAGQSGTIADATGIRVNSPIFSGTVPTTNLGINIVNQGASGVASSSALSIQAQSGSTRNYAILSAGGNLHGFGTFAPTRTVDIVGTLGVVGTASISGNFEVGGFASASQTFGSGLSDCDSASSKLLWDVTTGRFSCGTVASSFSGLDVDAGGSAVKISSLSFAAGMFNFANTASLGTVTLDWGPGGPASLSQAESVAGAWEFQAGASLSSITLNGQVFTSFRPASNSLDWDEFVNAMTVDAATTINAAAGLTFTNASTSGSFETAILKATTITSDTALIQFTGSATVSSNFEIRGLASASQTFGSGLSDCDSASSKLLWDVTTGRFSCGTVTSSVFAGLEVQEGTGTFAHITSLSFSGAHFSLSNIGSNSFINLDWAAGGPASLSQGESVAGGWEFQSGASFSTLTINGSPITYAGNGRPTRDITLVPEYPGATLSSISGSCTTCIGFMTSDNEIASPFRNYYKWRTTQAASQSYDIWVKVNLPNDFSSFASISIEGFRSSTNDRVYFAIFDTANAQSSSTTGKGTSVATSNGAWTAATVTAPAGTYTAGQAVTLRIRMEATQNANVRVGKIRLEYLSSF